MTARTRITDDEREQIVEAIRAGGHRNEIARNFGRSPSTITGIAREAGMADAFDRSATKRATEARRADNAARRAELSTLMLDDALRLRRQLHEPAEYVSVTKDGTVVRYGMRTPTFADQRNLAVAVKVLADGASALERFDQDDGDHTAVDVWLRAIVGPPAEEEA